MDSPDSNAVRLRDLHRALIHEHAHRLVALSYGVPGHIEITPNPNGGLAQVHFKGRFTMYRQPRSLKALRIIGLSGALATMVMDDSALDEWAADDGLSFDESFSDTDRALAGSYNISDIRSALHRIRNVWPEIIEHAERDSRSIIATGDR